MLRFQCTGSGHQPPVGAQTSAGIRTFLKLRGDMNDAAYTYEIHLAQLYMYGIQLVRL